MNRTSKKQAKAIIHPATIQLLVDATWEYAHRMLWNNHPFSEIEIKQSKNHIREYYESIPVKKLAGNIHHYLSGYCIRVLIARDYVLDKSDNYIQHPCIWLNKRNPKGFAGTKS